MAVEIKFDSSHNPIQPTITLATKNGRRLGKISVQDLVVKGSLSNGFDMSFKVYKDECPSLWDNIVDFKCVWAKEWNQVFEIAIEESDNGSLVKNVTAVSLGKAELSQIKLYEKEINTEKDISRDDYKPTVFYNDGEPGASLLHRVLEKAPHYKIGHVDTSLKNLQRTFSFNDKTIQDAFKEISEEIGCLIVIDCGYDNHNRLLRTINAYDLGAVCLECGTRGSFEKSCTKCGSESIKPGYGKNTNIFVSTENLADSVELSVDTGSVKNCFKLEAGDDLMTAAVVGCNPNGTQYLWNISNDMMADMSDALVEKLMEYNAANEYYYNEHSVQVDADLRSKYNSLINKYSEFTAEYKEISENIIGFPALMAAHFQAIDFEAYLMSGLMPSPKMAETNASEQIRKIKEVLQSPVSVRNIDTASAATAESAVLGMAKAVVDSRYKISVSESTYANNRWGGIFTVTSYADEEDTAVSKERVTCDVNGDYEGYVKQKIHKTISKSVDDGVGIEQMFALSEEEFANEMRKYCLSRLDTFQNICQTCLDILIEHGLSSTSRDDDLYNRVYVPYYKKLKIIEQEIVLRESEIAIVSGSFDADGRLLTEGVRTFLQAQTDSIHNALNFEEFIGSEGMLEFAAYRREDTYRNANYISDGLNNAELFRMAQAFIDAATAEIYKSSNNQHTISAKLRNLLALKEFEPIVDKFELGNWIRVRIDGRVFKLRLIEYEIDFNNFENINVDFSDLVMLRDAVSDIESVINQASSMASSYDYVARQARRGESGNTQLTDWVERGLDLTKMRIIDSADNQNITWDNHGLLCKEYLPIHGKYDDKQLKIINRGLYLTDDGWQSSKAGIGDFTYWNPKSGKMEESYGVIADVIVGNIILSEDVGIYNQNNSITMNEDGFVITATPNDGDESKNLLLVQREVEQDGVRKYEKLLYLDDNGYLVLNGTVRFQTPGATDPAKSFEDITKKIEEDIGGVVDRIDGFNGLFFYIRYSEFEDGKDMTETPDANTKYIGTCNTDEKTAPTDPARYTWMKTKGDQGTHGIKGDDGTSQFLHIRYSDDSVKFTANGGKTLGDWIGTCVTQTDVAPTEFDAYQWSKFNGTDGINTAVLYLYKRDSINPGVFTKDLTYTFETGVLSGNLDGWTQTVPASDGNPCYMIQAIAASNEATDVVASTEWSTPVLFVADGVTGENGYNTATVYLYKRSITDVTIDWTNDITYTFASKTLDRIPEGWTTTVPDELDIEGEALYVTAGAFASKESTDTIAYTEWSAPVVLAKNGTNGTDGLNSATVFLYKRSASTVSKPSKAITYTFATGNMTDTDGWSKSLPDGTDPCYVVHATAISKDTTDVIESSEWSSPALFVKNGANGSNGSNGNNTAIVYLYQRSKTALSVNWSTQLTYTFSTKRLTSVPTGWSQSIPSGTDPLYVTMATAYGNTDTDTIDSNQWCTPVMMAQNGVDGERGTSILAITTAPSSYTTAVDGITPAYRIALATVAEQSGVATPKVGDVIRQSYYDYPIIYIKGSYVYTRARVSVRGASSYTHIRYSEYADGSSMSATPTNTTVYIGVAVSTSSTAPTTASSYTWSKFRGNDGIPGTPGTDGRTQYLHIKYSNNGETFSPDDGEEIGTYIGTLVDFNQEDSMTFSDYKWKQFTGDLTVDMEEIQRRIDDSADAIYDTIDQKEQGLIDKIEDETGGIREAVGTELNSIRDTIKNNYDAAMAEATRVMNDYRAEVGQYMEFGNSGLVLGASSSSFKTVIDNQGMYFKEGDAIVSYVKNNQLHIPNAVIESTMALGNFFFSPRSDGGVSLVWQDGASS